MAAPRAQLWPILADTERLNEALGLPHYRLRETVDDFGHRTFGEYEADDQRVRWEESPMEWAAPHWWRWEREYESGPFERTSATLILEEIGENKTKATYTLQAVSRSTVGRLLLMSGHLKKAAKELERVAKRAARHCRNPQGDFYSNLASEAAAKKGKRNKKRSNGAQVQSEQFGPMNEWIACAPTADLVALQPKRMARALGIEWNEALNLCHDAVRNDLLHMFIRLHCSACQRVTMEVGTPSEIPIDSQCRHCGAPIRRDLGKNVELVFKPDLRIRDVPDVVFCGGAPTRFPERILQQSIEGRERRSFDLNTHGAVIRPRIANGAIGDSISSPADGGLTIRFGDDWIDTADADDAIVLENHGIERAVLILERQDGNQETTMVAEARAVQPWYDSFDTATLALGQNEPGGRLAILAVRTGAAPRSSMLRAVLQNDGAVFRSLNGFTILGFLTPQIAIGAAEKILAEIPDSSIGASYGEVLLSATVPMPVVSGPPLEVAIALADGLAEGRFEVADSFEEATMELDTL